MRIQLNFKSGVPVYRQIVDQIKTAVATGTLQPGDQLPTIRTLAQELRINRNTVARAYEELEAQGVIENLHGKGCFVRAGGTPLRKEARRMMLREPIDALLVQAHHLQISLEELLALIRNRADALGLSQSSSEKSSRSKR